MRCYLQFEVNESDLRMVRRQVAEWAGALTGCSLAAADIEIALGEALANAYAHAYHRASGPVDLEIVLEPTLFRCSVRDYGQAVPVFPSIPANPLEAKGWGLLLINRVMDGLEITCPDGEGCGVQVRMWKALAGQGPESVRSAPHVQPMPGLNPDACERPAGTSRIALAKAPE